MAVPTNEQLTAELTRLYTEAHPGEELPYLEVEEALPMTITYYVRIGSTTHQVQIGLGDLMGPMDYITDCLALADLVKPVAIV